MFNNRFFETREEAEAFKKAHGGVLYSNTPHSMTKAQFRIEKFVALDARQEIVDEDKTPFCVAWNE